MHNNFKGMIMKNKDFPILMKVYQYMAYVPGLDFYFSVMGFQSTHQGSFGKRYIYRLPKKEHPESPLFFSGSTVGLKLQRKE